MLAKTAPLAVLTFGLVACSPQPAPPAQPTTIQLLDVSDWHAQLDPLTVGSGTSTYEVGARRCSAPTSNGTARKTRTP